MGWSEGLEEPTPRPGKLQLNERPGGVWETELPHKTSRYIEIPQSWERDWAAILWRRTGLYTLRVYVRSSRARFYSLEGPWEERNASSAVIELTEGARAQAYATSDSSLVVRWDGETLRLERL